MNVSYVVISGCDKTIEIQLSQAAKAASVKGKEMKIDKFTTVIDVKNGNMVKHTAILKLTQVVK